MANKIRLWKMRHGTQQKMKSLVDVLEFAQKSKVDVVDIVWGDEDIEVQELHTLISKAVDARCGRTTQNATAVGAEFAPPKVVHEDQNDVGPVLGECWRTKR